MTDAEKHILWSAWWLLNEIRARDGTAYYNQRFNGGFQEEYRSIEEFDKLVEDLNLMLGYLANPWPPVHQNEN